MPITDAPRRCRPICDRKNWKDEPPKNGSIKTVCKVCGRFIGYRPTKDSKPPQQ